MTEEEKIKNIAIGMIELYQQEAKNRCWSPAMGKNWSNTSRYLTIFWKRVHEEILRLEQFYLTGYQIRHKTRGIFSGIFNTIPQWDNSGDEKAISSSKILNKEAAAFLIVVLAQTLGEPIVNFSIESHRRTDE